MNNYNKLINNLETLKLFKFKDKLDDYIDLIYDRLEMFDSKNIDKGIELGFSKVKKRT